MSDPAIDAAQRAEQASGWWKSAYSTPWDADYATDAAREALKPIREKIRELQADIPTDDPKFGEGLDYAIAELAPFIYPTEELES